MGEVTIRPFENSDAAGVANLIVGIQRDEYDIPITADEQPDLASIPHFYQTGAGNFWVAAVNGEVVGTLGLRDMGDGDVALRKMFVAREYRGEPHRVAQRLLAAALAWAGETHTRNIFLGTTSRFLAAHRFYEKNGFELVAREALPETFPLMAVDTRFYKRPLSAGRVSERLRHLGHLMTGVVLILKGSTKLSHPDGYWSLILVALIGGAGILLGTVFHTRLEHRFRSFESVVYFIEAGVCALVGAASVAHGTERIHYVWFLAAGGFLAAGIVLLFSARTRAARERTPAQ